MSCCCLIITYLAIRLQQRTFSSAKRVESKKFDQKTLNTFFSRTYGYPAYVYVISDVTAYDERAFLTSMLAYT